MSSSRPATWGGYVASDTYHTERLEFARGPNSILFGDGNPGGINTTFTKQALFVPRRSVHEEVRQLLKEWDGVPIDQSLENTFARYRYFGVSALGRSATPEARVAATGIQPYRVADPLLWLLSEFGSVPKAGRG